MKRNSSPRKIIAYIVIAVAVLGLLAAVYRYVSAPAPQEQGQTGDILQTHPTEGPNVNNFKGPTSPPPTERSN